MPTKTKERPILFNGAMVRSILSGAKTQTRRPVKPQPANTPQRPSDGRDLLMPSKWIESYGKWRWHHVHGANRVTAGQEELTCPFGRPGDRLWVRETFAVLRAVSPAADEPLPLGPGERLIEPPTQCSDGRWNYDGKVIAYRANSDIEFCDGNGFTGPDADRSDMPRWSPSIHMPRWASRITLEVTDVRVERVRSISEEDAKAEGAPLVHEPHLGQTFKSHRAGFEALWQSTYGEESWEANQWVWAITFKRITGGAE